MARLIVQFPGDAAVLVDGAEAGRTNQVIPLPRGEHMVRLEGEVTEPPERTVAVTPEAAADDIVRVGFSPSAPGIDRFSPLYCSYNGFLLGQFLSLSFARYGHEDYPIRRSRMLEFLQEAGVTVDLPEQQPELGSDAHTQLLTDAVQELALRSQPLAEFVLLGTLLTHYGVLAEADPETAQATLEQAEFLRDKHKLPPIDPGRFVLRPDSDVDEVLSPSLAYLADVVDQLEVEPDTAFVIMPFKAPYAGYFPTFYRPSLEQAGYRAFRAWGGLSSEDYCDLLLKLIAKSGIVWADVSELNYNVLYEIGAAHALGKLSMLVVSEDSADATPANIGHDAIVRYTPTADDWPEGATHLVAMLIAALTAAAERGERLRVSADALTTVVEDTGRLVAAILTPPEALDAQQEGQNKLAAGDYAGAEPLFDDAIRLGLDDSPTMLGRGLSRYGLERYADAEADLDRVLTEVPDPEVPEDQRRVAAYFRGLAREQQDNLSGALADYGLAIDLGYDGADVFQRRASVRLALGDVGAAREDVERARKLEPDSPDTNAVDGEVLSAEARFEEAVAAYDRALAQEQTADSEFGRALTLLVAARPDEALAGYRRGVPLADRVDIERALAGLEMRAAGQSGAEACKEVLEGAKTS